MNAKRETNFTSYFYLILFICFACYFSYYIYNGIQMRISLRSHPKKVVVATVIDETSYWGNSGVSHLHTYKYRFFVDSKEYTGICPNIDYKVGDTLSVEYVIDHPDYNISYPVMSD